LSTLSGGTGLEAAATAAAAYCCWNSDELLKELLAEHSAWVAELQLVKEELQLACLLLVSGKDMLSSSMRVSPSLSTVSLMVQQPLETLSRELTEGGSSGFTISKREECFRLERVCCWRLKCFCAWLWCGTRIQECQREVYPAPKTDNEGDGVWSAQQSERAIGRERSASLFRASGLCRAAARPAGRRGARPRSRFVIPARCCCCWSSCCVVLPSMRWSTRVQVTQGTRPVARWTRLAPRKATYRLHVPSVLRKPPRTPLLD
jgi:hypothetical protein